MGIVPVSCSRSDRLVLSPGVIAGIVSFCLLHAFEYILDLLSARTNGAFGSTTPSIQPDHSINPKDSAHNGVAGPGPNGKAAVADEEVCTQTNSPVITCERRVRCG